MTKQILVQYDNSEESMYDNGEGGEIDFAASEAEFESQLMDALSSAFPGSEITIETGHGKYSVDGDTDTDDAETVGEYVNRVWSTFEWVVEK